MTGWTEDKEHGRTGIAGPILIHQNQWKRPDGFGHMTDAEVLEYKKARPDRYPEETYVLKE